MPGVIPGISSQNYVTLHSLDHYGRVVCRCVATINRLYSEHAIWLWQMITIFKQRNCHNTLCRRLQQQVQSGLAEWQASNQQHCYKILSHDVTATPTQPRTQLQTSWQLVIVTEQFCQILSCGMQFLTLTTTTANSLTTNNQVRFECVQFIPGRLVLTIEVDNCVLPV